MVSKAFELAAAAQAAASNPNMEWIEGNTFPHRVALRELGGV